jgi:alpha-tubulin suppressor-like RCC1 family protein
MALGDVILVSNPGALSQYILDMATGNAWVSGYNGHGQLGLGDTSNRTSFVSLSGTWTYFDATTTWAAGVRSSGALNTCGYGQGSYPLGYSKSGDQLTFAIVGSDTDWAYCACGSIAGYAVKTSGALYVWGDNTQGQIGAGAGNPQLTPYSTGITVAAVAAGSQFSIILKTDGTLWSTGLNSEGELGVGDTTDRSAYTQIGSATTWSKISCGSEHAAAIKTDGTLWTWGYNNHGQLGVSDTTHRLSPTQVGSATDWVDVKCASYHTYARKTAGTVWAAGYNNIHQLVLGASDTTQRTTFSQVGTAVWNRLAGSAENAYVISDTGMYGGGGNEYGDLGIANTSEQGVLVAIDVASLGISIPIVQSVVETLVASGEGIIIQVLDLLEAADGVDDLSGLLDTMLIEAIAAQTTPVATLNTTVTLAVSAAAHDVLQVGIQQLVAEAANGTNTVSLSLASALVDAVAVIAAQAATFNTVMAVAEMIVAVDLANAAAGYDVTESSAAADVLAARISRVYAMLETALAVDTGMGVLTLYQTVTDATAATIAITSTGSLITALLDDTMLATIRLNIGGETFTGWVLNTDTLAPSEYQFADRQFNSTCKHGSKYLMAAEDGVYEFTEETGVESVMTYIKTGKTDFGSDLKKRIVNSYIVYSASGNMVLKVTTSEYGQLQTRNYRLVPPSNSETTDVRRVDLGRGIKSRYWQFELVGDGVDCDIDEIGMLPIVLSRRL